VQHNTLGITWYIVLFGSGANISISAS